MADGETHRPFAASELGDSKTSMWWHKISEFMTTSQKPIAGDY